MPESISNKDWALFDFKLLIFLLKIPSRKVKIFYILLEKYYSKEKIVKHFFIQKISNIFFSRQKPRKNYMFLVDLVENYFFKIR